MGEGFGRPGALLRKPEGRRLRPPPATRRTPEDLLRPPPEARSSPPGAQRTPEDLHQRGVVVGRGEGQFVVCRGQPVCLPAPCLPRESPAGDRARDTVNVEPVRSPEAPLNWVWQQQDGSRRGVACHRAVLGSLSGGRWQIVENRACSPRRFSSAAPAHVGSRPAKKQSHLQGIIGVGVAGREMNARCTRFGVCCFMNTPLFHSITVGCKHGGGGGAAGLGPCMRPSQPPPGL